MVLMSLILFLIICDCKYLFFFLSCKIELFSDCKFCKSVVIFFLDSLFCNISLLFEVVNFLMFLMYFVIDFVLFLFFCVRVDFNFFSVFLLVFSFFICFWFVFRVIFNLLFLVCKLFIFFLSFIEDEFSVLSLCVFFLFFWIILLICFCK